MFDVILIVMMTVINIVWFRSCINQNRRWYKICEETINYYNDVLKNDIYKMREKINYLEHRIDELEKQCDVVVEDDQSVEGE